MMINSFRFWRTIAFVWFAVWFYEVIADMSPSDDYGAGVLATFVSGVSLAGASMIGMAYLDRVERKRRERKREHDQA